MSAALLDGSKAGWSHRHVGSWATSLALHGLVGGIMVWLITLFTLSPPPPVIEAPFRWDVAVISAPVSASAPFTPPASIAKSSVAQPPVQATRASPVSALTESAAVPPAIPEAAPRASTETSEPVPSSPSATEVSGAVIASATGPQEIVTPAIEVPVVASTPLSPPTPPVRAVNTGELGDLLWRRMEALKRYPYLARRNGWEGKVLIRVVLGGDGRLLHAEIQESSGHEVLDQDALQVLRAATLLKTEPNLAWQQQATFTLPVAYRLQ